MTLHNLDAWAGTRRCDSLAVALGRLGAEACKGSPWCLRRMGLGGGETGTRDDGGAP
jgi:hypothetical protein